MKGDCVPVVAVIRVNLDGLGQVEGQVQVNQTVRLLPSTITCGSFGCRVAPTLVPRNVPKKAGGVIGIAVSMSSFGGWARTRAASATTARIFRTGHTTTTISNDVSLREA